MLLCFAVRPRASVALALCASLAASACSLSHSVFRPHDAAGLDADVPGDHDVVALDRPDVPTDTLPPDDAPPDAPTCPTGQTLCASTCVSLGSDPNNCGACGSVCMAGYECRTSSCTLVCPTGQTACGGRCVTTASDPTNCGACGTACAGGQVCASGACTTTCPAPRTMCPSGACTDLLTDAMNCGACARACAAGQSCVGGACMLVCPAGQTPCGDRCVNTVTDPNNCGVCGRVCMAPANGTVACMGSTCVAGCVAGYHMCGTHCAADTSLTECGAACAPCAAPTGGGVSCTGGTCTPSCPSPSRLCTATMSCVVESTSSCGAACTPCPTVANGTATCTGGACGFTCNTGYMPSGMACVPTPPMTCGNQMLDAGETCDDGNTTSGDGCSATCAIEANVIVERCSSTTFTIDLTRSGVTQIYRGTTNGAVNDGNSCHGDGPEVLLAVRVPAGGRYTVTLTPLSSWDVVARVGAPCPGSTCVDMGGAGMAETYIVNATAGVTGFHIVDGYNAGDHGDFTIAFRLM